MTPAETRHRRALRVLRSFSDRRGIVIRMLPELASDAEISDLLFSEDLQALQQSGQIELGEITIHGAQYLLVRLQSTVSRDSLV